MSPRTITAAWLREFRPSHGVLPLDADVAAMLADALEIADDSARSDIELYAPLVVSMVPSFYDSRATDPIFRPYVEKAMRYLGARGLIERHPEQPHLVRVLDKPEADA